MTNNYSDEVVNSNAEAVFGRSPKTLASGSHRNQKEAEEGLRETYTETKALSVPVRFKDLYMYPPWEQLWNKLQQELQRYTDLNENALKEYYSSNVNVNIMWNKIRLDSLQQLKKQKQKNIYDKYCKFNIM